MTFRKMFGLGLLGVAMGAIGCSGPSVRVTVNRGVDTSAGKVVVLPMLLCDGKALKPANAGYSNPAADERVASQWSTDLGPGNSMAVSKGVMNNVPGAYDGINTLIGTLDAAGSIEQSTSLTSFLRLMSTTFVDGALAITLVFEDEREYLASRVVHVNMGLLDPKTLKWKWTTKATSPTGTVTENVSYETAVKNLIGDSFAALKKKSGGSIR